MSQAEIKLVEILKSAPSVTGVVSNRIYPVLIPQGASLPAITYQRVGGWHEQTLQGYSGVENPQIQVDCWATSYAAAKALGLAVRDAVLASTRFTAVLVSEDDIFYETDLIHCVSMDFSIWNTESEA